MNDGSLTEGVGSEDGRAHRTPNCIAGQRLVKWPNPLGQPPPNPSRREWQAAQVGSEACPRRRVARSRIRRPEGQSHAAAGVGPEDGGLAERQAPASRVRYLIST